MSALISVPIVDLGNGLDGPDVPDGWVYEQWSDSLDTGKPANHPRRAMVLVEVEDAVLDPWLDAHSDVTVRKLLAEEETLRGDSRSQGRGSSARAQARVMRTQLTNAMRANVISNGNGGGGGRPPFVGRRRIFMLVAALGLAGAARYLNVELEWLGPVLAGTWLDNFTAANGTEIDGRTLPDAEAGATWDVTNGFTGLLEVQSNEMQNVSGSGNYCRIGNPGAAQYSECILGTFGGSGGAATRMTTTGTALSSGYSTFFLSTTRVRVLRITGGLTGTVIADYSGLPTMSAGTAIRLESDGNDHETFTGGVSRGTVADSNHTSGETGTFNMAATLTWQSIEMGDLGATGRVSRLVGSGGLVGAGGLVGTGGGLLG